MVEAKIGPISEGTLRPQDLLDTFAYKLSKLADNHTDRRLADDAIKLMHDVENDTADNTAVQDTLDDLMDRLSSYAPSYCYFGANPGDGACFGFWIDEDAIQEDRHDGFLEVVSDLSELDGAHEAALVVNDHGNMTLYENADNGWREVWAVV